MDIHLSAWACPDCGDRFAMEQAGNGPARRCPVCEGSAGRPRILPRPESELWSLWHGLTVKLGSLSAVLRLPPDADPDGREEPAGLRPRACRACGALAWLPREARRCPGCGTPLAEDVRRAG